MLEKNFNCLVETVGRSMNDKGAFSEVSDGNKEYVSGNMLLEESRPLL